MDLIVRRENGRWVAHFGDRRFACAIGRGGVTRDKREGDGATPVGCWPFRRVLYRADRGPAPDCRLAVAAIAEDDGWCDDPDHPQYNRPVKLPFAARHERLRRRDRLYDLLVVLGHNDDPPRRAAGSAIFLHVASESYDPTEGCVALAPADLAVVVSACDGSNRLCVEDG